MIACDLFLYMYKSRRTVQSLAFGSYIFQKLNHHRILGLTGSYEIEIPSWGCWIFSFGDGIHQFIQRIIEFLICIQFSIPVYIYRNDGDTLRRLMRLVVIGITDVVESDTVHILLQGLCYTRISKHACSLQVFLLLSQKRSPGLSGTTGIASGVDIHLCLPFPNRRSLLLAQSRLQ